MTLDPTKERIPIRIQRKRTAGWRKPEGTINCTRPGKYGNPFIINGDMLYLNVRFRRKMLYPGKFWGVYPIEKINEVAVDLFAKFFNGDFEQSHDPDILYWVKHFKEINIRETLKGHDLMCFCKLTDKCHVDILLSIANNGKTL